MSAEVELAQAPLRALKAAARIHMIGVAGAGMNALAGVLLERGYRVSGSDQQATAQVARLIDHGLVFYSGHAASQVAGVDLVIISAAVREENPEVVAACAAGVPVVKRAAALGWLLEELRTIAVAGTHGKTTTTAMLAVILRHAGLDPTFVVGGEVLDLDTSAAWGTGTWAVVEADEYDRSFLQLRPEVALITNVEPDHLEYFGSAGAMYAAFAQFMTQTVPGGFLVLNRDDAHFSAMAVPEGLHLVTCSSTSVGKSDWRMTHLEQGEAGLRCRLEAAGASPPTAVWLTMPLSGLHNAMNAMQAVAAAQCAGVAPEVAVEALRRFRGTGRRFQVVGEAADVLVIDDYAHHPTEIRATLAAARARFPHRRLVASFQPHTYSRTKLLFDDFVTAFDGADQVVLTSIYAARETDTLGIESGDLERALVARLGRSRVTFIPQLAEIPVVLTPDLGPGDLLLTLGAGTITQVGPQVVALLEGG